MDEPDLVLQLDTQRQYDSTNLCLGQSLEPYVLSKIDFDALTEVPSEVIVRHSDHDDMFSQPLRSTKVRKRFNNIRPTQKLVRHGSTTTLEITCFPGEDYVKHYAHLAQAFLYLRHAAKPTVTCILPTRSECSRAITKSNLTLMGKVDTVVVGYVEHLHRLTNTTWECPTVDGCALFGWQKKIRSDGHIVSFLGCRTSFWGDIAGHLVDALVLQNGANCILYVGKAGTLCREIHPNQALATGSSSCLGGSKVVWDNVLQNTLQLQNIPEVLFGPHVNVSTPLDETKAWLSAHQDQYNWVDCEVGYMAQSCLSHNIGFGFLHVISDSLVREYGEHLANERLDSVVEKRAHLLNHVQNVLQSYLQLDVP